MLVPNKFPPVDASYQLMVFPADVALKVVLFPRQIGVVALTDVGAAILIIVAVTVVRGVDKQPEVVFLATA